MADSAPKHLVEGHVPHDGDSLVYDAALGGWKPGRTWAKESFTASAGDESNGYLDLAQVAGSNSIIVHAYDPGTGDQAALTEGASLDYTVSYTGGVGGATRITFTGAVAFALTNTCKVQVHYQY
jgi:hypothetical protein